MELEEYIKNVVFQIADGVSKVIDEQHTHNVIINPEMTIGNLSDVRFIPTNKHCYKQYERPVQLLQLEMGIETTEENKLEVKAGLQLPILNAGGNNSDNIMHSNVNRVKIAIPICLPITKIE